MCLILLSYRYHPNYKLIIAANRDEFYSRKTAPAKYWDEHKELIGGRDLVAGGTWMGLNTSGKISMLTNYRDLNHIKNDAPSRGQLVSDYLISNEDPQDYLKKISVKGTHYNGFNLICGDINQLFYYGNYQNGVHEILPGIHGLSNALLDTSWPKVDKGIKKFGLLASEKHINPTTLFETLYDDIKAPDDLLPDTGVGWEKEKMLSPMFIKSPGYGSRSSTVLLVDNHNHMQFVERTYNVEDFTYSDVEFEMDF